MNVDLSGFRVSQLWTLWRDVLAALSERGVLRSTGGPVGDYGEWLVATALHLTRQSYPNPAFDATDDAGMRYSIKTRRWSRPDPPTRIALGQLTEGSFDHLVFLLLNDEMRVIRCAQLPFEAVAGVARISKGQWFMTRSKALSHELAIDLTARVQAFEDAYEPQP